MCAAQYEQIPIAYGLKRYEKFREAYLRHAMHLRQLAKQDLKALPSEVDKGNQQILGSLETRRVYSQETADAILRIAKSDARIKTALVGQSGVHAYPSFQGCAWIVRFSNQSRGNLATLIIDAETLKVLDVGISGPGKSETENRSFRFFN